ncbi:hypothetical protein ACJJTC_016082 [Scirpophaga incertulas]
MRYGTINITEPKRKRKLDVIPGKSVGYAESEDYVETEIEETQIIEEIENIASIKKNKTNGKVTKKEEPKTTPTLNDKLGSASDSLSADLENMPIVYEDVLFYGEEITTNENELLQSSLPAVIVEDSVEQAILPDIKKEKSTRKIIGNEKLLNKQKITLKNCKLVDKNEPLKVYNMKNNDPQDPQPSTSGLKLQKNRRRPSYYRNDSDILRDLMDELV